MWCEPAEIEWARRVTSIVACCHSVKLCALACSGFPITTMWCFLLGPGCEYGARCNLNKKNVRLSASLQKGGNVGATFQLVLHRKCDSPQTGCAQTATHKYMWREQEKIEWSHRIISIVACCHSVKPCTFAARAFWSQHKKYTSLSFACPTHENDQRWTCTWIWI